MPKFLSTYMSTHVICASMLSIAIGLSMLFGTKHRGVPPAPKSPRPPTARALTAETTWALAMKHPDMQKICDAVGGCENVELTCTRYDGSGNTSLRNAIAWEINAGNIHVITFKSESTHPLEAAIAGWLNQYSQTPHYPKTLPCDSSCE